VFADATAENAWTVSSDGFIPVGYFTKPTLALDFANMTTLDSRITFTRASGATYFDSSGVLQTAASGVARFDHNPTTLAPLGLLIEEQRTNLVTYSEDFANAAWTKTRSSITANTIVAPDGTLTGDKLVENTDNNTHLIVSNAPSLSSGTVYAVTVFAKAAERTNFALQLGTGSEAFGASVPFAYFNLSNGTTSGASSATATMTSIGNGWYRCSLVTIAATATAATSVRIKLANSTPSDSYTGDGFSGIFIWGAQLEAGAFPTSYIPTVAAAATRNADVASMTGTNFSSWYRADEGTVYVDSPANSSASNITALTISDNTSSNRFFIGTGGNNTVWNPFVITSGVGVATLTQSNLYPPQTNPKIVLAYQVDNFAASVSGNTAVTDTSGALPVVNRLYIGASATGGANLNGTIRKIAFYPTRLSNAQLQALTR
jgi:hypothetical protein